MPRFHPLRVTELHRTIRDAVVVTLQPANGAAAEFAFDPGQYLTFRQEIDGTELRRTYSICAGLDDGALQVAIKRVEGGAFSTWANENLQVGDTLDAMPPTGRFIAELDPHARHHYLAFAAGSGITPILSITRSVLSREPQSRITLVYSNRMVTTIMFREELEDLKNRFMGRLNVIHILGGDVQDIDLFSGRLTEEKCAQLFEYWIDVGSADGAFICGPEGMMQSVARALETAGMPQSAIKFELFTAAQKGRLKRSKTTASKASDKAELAITLDGATQQVPMTEGQTILEAARSAMLDAPFACEAGVCSTCRCQVIEGEVEMRANHALEDYEVAKGYVLSCQAVAVSKRLAVSYDT